MSLLVTHARDHFGALKSDGRGLVVAVGGQPNEGDSRTFFYVIEAERGKIISTIPAPHLGTFCVGDGYLGALIPLRGKQKLEITSLKDGKVVFTLSDQNALQNVQHIAIAGGMLRLIAPCGTDRYYSLTTYEAIDPLAAQQQIARLSSEGVLDSSNPWRLDDAVERSTNVTTVGPLTIMIDLSETWIVAVRSAPQSPPSAASGARVPALNLLASASDTPERAFYELREAVTKEDIVAISKLVYLGVCPRDRAHPDSETVRYWLKEGYIKRELSDLAPSQVDTAVPRIARDALIRSGLLGAEAVRIVCREQGRDPRKGSQHIESLCFTRIDGAWRWFRADVSESWLFDRSSPDWVARSICCGLKFCDASLLYSLMDPALKPQLDEKVFVKRAYAGLLSQLPETHAGKRYVAFPAGCMYPHFETEPLTGGQEEARVWVLNASGQRDGFELMTRSNGAWYWRPSVELVKVLQAADR